MRILTIDAALGRCSAGLVVDDVCIDEQSSEVERGHAGLASMVRNVGAAGFDLVAVTVGPGSFTGLRTAIALAHGVGLGAGVGVVAVSVAEALADALPELGQRALWVVIDSRRNRVFLQRDGAALVSVAIDRIAPPQKPVAVAGDAAIAVAAWLAAKGHDVMLTSARRPAPRHIASLAARRARGELPPLAVLPIYVDPPEARETPQRPPPRQ